LVLSFLQNVAERALIRAIATTFDRYAGIDGSEDAREDAAGPIDVCATAVAESVQHHSLFPGDAAKKQNPKADHAGKAGNRVRQQQCLSDSPTR
jgi:hypothetical protein